jgi:2-polyprenyl-6-hydroxyphenyl methylase/3-demethylubiquinone-9 3-methyltransferase
LVIVKGEPMIWHDPNSDLGPQPITANPGDVARFAAIAEEWWDPDGRFETLHQLNPIRLAFIRDRVARLTGRDPAADLPFAGLRVLDIGCGGGLLSEPAAFLGAHVVGIDASAKLIEVARTHAALMGMHIDYRHALAEDLASAGERFDVILNTEVIEHVANVDRFVACCCRMLKPNGIMIVATLNRTLKSFLYAKVAGEYIIGLLPRGTHDWRRFIKPEELAQKLRRSGVLVGEFVGVSFNPVFSRFRITTDLGANYMAAAQRPAPRLAAGT